MLGYYLCCSDRYSDKITQETVYPGSQLSMVKLRWEELEAAEQSGSREQGMTALPRSGGRSLKPLSSLGAKSRNATAQVFSPLTQFRNSATHNSLVFTPQFDKIKITPHRHAQRRVSQVTVDSAIHN